MTEQAKKRPVFHNIALVCNGLAAFFLVYLYGGFYGGNNNAGAFFDGLQFVIFSLIALAIGFVCAVIGYNRKESLNLITKISSGLSMILAVVIFMIWKNS